MSNNLPPEVIAQCQARIEELFKAGNSLALWAVLRNNDNTTSRKHVQTLDASAPAWNAPMKEWHAYVVAKFPDFEAKAKEEQAKQEAESAKRQAEWDKRELTYLATSGNSWSRNGVIYGNSLLFVQQVLSEGFAARKEAFGRVAFMKGDILIGPVKNKHINAALKLIEVA